MILRQQLFLTLLTINEILTLTNCQEYLKDLKPKEFKFIHNDQLPPVALPQPFALQRIAKSLNGEEPNEEQIKIENRSQKSQRPSLMELTLEASVREGLNAMRHLYTEVEPNLVKNGQLLQENHPAALLSKFSAPVIDTTKREMAAYATLTAAKIFRKSYELNNDLARQAHSEKVSLRRTALESLCPPRDAPTCMPASERYRTHDGTCNNKNRLRWGAAQMPFNRFLPPEYGDGVDSTRKSANGGPLSSSRFVSLLVHGARDGEAPLTLMLVQWGQLLDHDMTSTAQPRSINGSVPSCCGSKNFHPSCFPIKVPLDDPWLSPLKVRCLEFLRSAPAQRRDCVLSWREQTNQATSYIDASPIYSSSVKSSDNARVFRKGLLIFGRGSPADDVCQRGALAPHCIRSGDGRSSEQPGLLALHHVWVNEHNLIAVKLSEINLHWSDEKIYQETRRIIGAMFQHITFREFLPIVLGREVLKLFDLELLNTGFYEGYDPKINPTVANAFAAAAFRFGHSLVQSSYMRCDRFHNAISNNVSLHEEFQRGDIGSVGSLHRLLRGMATQRALKRDEFITPELTNHLFQTPGFPFGLDLAAINVQRGRDHGIPPYTHWREPCGLSPINTWEDFANVVGPESAQRISHAYQSVFDIDLFVGGIAERPVVGGLVGPTLACIIAQQFSNSRRGDRFWYENAGFESSFTPAQLHSIRKVTLASVLCRAVGGGTFQPLIFLPPQAPNNERLPCGTASLTDFDIEPWLEQDPFAALGITHRPAQQPSLTAFKQTTFQSHTLTDRIFDITKIETKSPGNTDPLLGDHKVGFSNRQPAITVIKDASLRPSNGLMTQAINGKINDKLDLNKRRHTIHVTKQKPVPAVNNKLDKNNHKGGNRRGTISTSTKRTIIVNNVPIELRNAGRDKVKRVPSDTESEAEPRLGNKDIMADIKKTGLDDTKLNKEYEDQRQTEFETQIKMGEIQSKNNVVLRETEARTGNADILASEEQIDVNNTTNNQLLDKNQKQMENYTKVEVFENKRNDELRGLSTTKNDMELKMQNEDFILQKNQTSETEKQTFKDQITENTTKEITKISKSPDNKIDKDKNKPQNTDKSETKIDLPCDLHSAEIIDKNNNSTINWKREMHKIKTDHFLLDLNDQNQKNNLKDSKQQEIGLENIMKNNTYGDKSDSDIDPMAQTVPITHKRVQRKLTLPNIADQHKDKSKEKFTKNTLHRNDTQNRPTTTKAPKSSRTTLRPLELRQYQNRPSYSKAPQKVIVDSINGDNQYEIEINIRQTNKSPKPGSTTPHKVEYTNVYNPSQIDRYTNFYPTTPIYAYYQPTPTQISSLDQNQRTKPPTIIFVDEHEDHKTSKLPGFLQSIVSWNSPTRRPLPASIGFNDKPNLETLIGSPHSTANNPPNYKKPPSHLALPATSSSFSQAQVDTSGQVQVSSASVSNGNFGSIAGFASANGADSTFSFNIRPKPDKSQSNAASYGLQLPQRKPWYEQNPSAGQHITNYDLPFRENVNSPFSTAHKNFYSNNNPGGIQRKEGLTLTPAHDFADYDYSGRTIQPLGNITSEEDTDEDYEYDEDYGTSILISNFNKDGYLRPEHMLETIHNNENATDKTNHTWDDNYVLPALNMTQNLPKQLDLDLPKPIYTNFSTDFPDGMGKHLQTDIFAEDDNNNTNAKRNTVESMTEVKMQVLRGLHHKRNRNRHKNHKRRKHEKIAFAPLNILTKPERPDNWVLFDSPQSQQETALPQLPELVMDPLTAAEIPKPIKENIWVDFSNFKRTEMKQFSRPLEHLNLQKTDKETEQLLGKSIPNT